MKYILFIGDGMADNPVDSLGGKTPIEYADIPTIDKLASKALVGSVSNVPEGLPAGSDTAILSIFGCDIQHTYSGRAPLEAAANDIFLEKGNVAYRCNIISLEDSDTPFEKRRILSHSAGSIEGEDALEVMHTLFKDERFQNAMKKAGMKIYEFPNFRQTAVQGSADITGMVLYPPHDHLGEVIENILPEGCSNAELLTEVMKVAFEVLDKSEINRKRRAEGKMPANCVWLWAEGTAPTLSSFKDSFGHNGAVVSAVPLVQGIAKLIGLDVYLVEGATGEIDTNFEGKLETVINLIDKYDFVTLHIEAPDECTHNGDLKGKIQSIEWLDSRAMTPLVKALDEKGYDYRILFLSDHKTLTSNGAHDADPVPFMIYDSRRDVGTVKAFNEKECAKGIKIPKGIMLMPMLFEI